MNKAPTLSRLISVPEAAAYTGVSPHTIYTMVNQWPCRMRPNLEAVEECAEVPHASR